MAGQEPPSGQMTIAQAADLLAEDVAEINRLIRAGILSAHDGLMPIITTVQKYSAHKKEWLTRGTAARAGQHLGISERRFRELVARGIVPQAPKGQYEFEISRIAYIKHLQETAAGRQSDSGQGQALANERARLAKEQADAAARRNLVEAQEYLPRSEITQAMVAAGTRIRSKLLAFPVKLAPRLLGLQALHDVKEVISDAIREVLEEFAETRVVGISPLPDGKPAGEGNAPRVVGVLPATAQANGKRVGRSKSHPKP